MMKWVEFHENIDESWAVFKKEYEEIQKPINIQEKHI